jgi:EmrB/QacA subfamily drug resistance transporter
LSEAVAAAPAAADSRIEPHVWRIASVVVLGSIMSILDTTIVNVALETLGRDLHATLSEIQWVLTGYMLSLGAVIPVTGWAARRFGARNVYILSLVIFTASSVLCGLAGSTSQLILFRVLQGIGGGMILPVGQMMMAHAAGPQRMGRIMGITAIPVMLAPIIGPTLGGLIVDNMSWRWIFFVNVPIGAVALAAAWRILPRDKHGGHEKLDVIGLFLLAVGVPAVTYGLAEIGATGHFTTPRVVVPILVGAVLIVIFAFHALRAARPLLDLRLYRRATYSSASVAMFCLAAALFGGMILIPLYWQQIRAENALHTGLLMAPMGLGMILVLPLVGRLADRVGGGPLALVGVIVTTFATIPFGLIGAHTPIAYLCGAMVVRGMGVGLAFMPAMTAAFASLQRSELPDATPQMNVLQRIGGSIGTAVLAVVLQRSLTGATSLDDAAAAFGTAFWWSVAITAAAIIPCVVLVRAEHRARAAAGAVATQLPVTDEFAESAA